ncbi:ABC transporter substrate-binding protein [Nocardia carnea]|uniref:ABC transporter substrate-binding protein n=1 Tax=Nocardia carnea TaxID=37328 RepID=UPI0024545571|nr:ABC transporter substrate-binding protein [Nocardia carnea]
MRTVRTGGRTRTVLVTLAGILALLSAGCGVSAEESAGGVTIPHAFGETVVESAPTKIVALGNQWLDTVQAFGIVPAGYIDNVATMARRTPAWEPESLQQATALNTGGDITEQVAALEPDLILADPFLADRTRYDQLSKIAPTLPGLSDKAAAPWPDLVTTLGKVLGREADAGTIVADVWAQVDAVAAANPGLKGTTFLSTWLAGPTQLMVLNDPEDGSGQLFTRLGMTIPQHIRDMPASGGRVSLSPERVGELTSDLLIAGYSVNQDEAYRQLPGYGELPAVRKDAVVFLDNADIGAINQPTVLSLPYILKEIEPALVNAAK